MLVKQSSAVAALKFFMTDSSDHLTGKTGLSPTVTISKDGSATFATPAGAVSEMANGWYKVAGHATDSNTLGEIALHATAAGADPCDGIVAEVVAFDPRDAAALGLSRLDVTISSRMATFTLPANFANLAIDGNGRVDLVKVVGAAINALIAGRLDVNAQVVADKTGYALTAGQVPWTRNTALNNFEFMMFDSTTGLPKTGLTVTPTRDIDHAGFAACANAVTEVGNGFYVINYAASDLNGGVIAFRMTAPGAVDLGFTVVTHN